MSQPSTPGVAFGNEPEAAPEAARGSAPRPDLAAARGFIEALTGSADTPMTFVALPDRKGDGRNPHQHAGPLAQVSTGLAAANAAGYGVFVVVNEAPPGRREDADITGIRAVYVDADWGDAQRTTALLARLDAAGVPPSIIVETSPGNAHVYWLTDDCAVERHKAVQKALAQALGTDPSVSNPARLMRVPGFIHHKGQPFRSTRFVHADSGPRVYWTDDLCAALKVDLHAPGSGLPVPGAGHVDPATAALMANLPERPNRVAEDDRAERNRLERAIDYLLRHPDPQTGRPWADDRDTWRNVLGGALYRASNGAKWGCELWIKASACWPERRRKYPGPDRKPARPNDPRVIADARDDCEAEWPKLAEDEARREAAGKPLRTIASIYKAAKDLGWTWQPDFAAVRQAQEKQSAGQAALGMAERFGKPADPPRALTDAERKMCPSRAKVVMVKGKPQERTMATVENFRHALRCHGLVTVWDVVTKRLLTNPPVDGGGAVGPKDLLRAYGWSVAEMNGFAKGVVDVWLGSLPDDGDWNPVTDCLSRLVWDGKPRFEEIERVLRVEPGYEVLRRAWVRVLILGAVAAADHGKVGGRPVFEVIPVLCGEENIGKTTFFEKFVPDKLTFYVKTGLPLDPKHPDQVRAATSAWITELGETDRLTRAVDASAFKAFMSQPIDEYRVPYARDSCMHERRTLFVGTTNPKEFLRDPNGNRRFAVLPLTAIDRADLDAIDKDQLWAEAWVRYQYGEPWTPDAAERVLFRGQAVEHEVRDPIEEMIQAEITLPTPPLPPGWWNGQGSPMSGISTVTTTEITTRVLTQRNGCPPDRAKLAASLVTFRRVLSALYRRAGMPDLPKKTAAGGQRVWPVLNW